MNFINFVFKLLLCFYFHTTHSPKVQILEDFRQTKADASVKLQPGGIEGTGIIRQLPQHPECQGQVD